MPKAIQIQLFTTMDTGADFSANKMHRFALWRIWDHQKPRVMFIGLNPSKANEQENDNTITKCIALAKYNGFGGLYMVNCWAYIATNPAELKIHYNAELQNNAKIKAIAKKCQTVVFAWGASKIIKQMRRDEELMAMFPQAKALHINQNGSPKHPLYCKNETLFIDFKNTTVQ